MKLSKTGIKNTAEWADAGIRLPQYDIGKMYAKTKEAPEWVHFGAGNIFRGFIGSINQQLLNKGLAETGIIAVETFDHDIIDKIYTPYDNLTLSVMMDAKSNLDIEVLASIAYAVKSSELDILRDIFAQPSLKVASYTITEKGYAIHTLDGSLMGIVSEDIAAGPAAPKHAMSITAAMLYHRYTSCGAPIAIVSMDNCSHNGEKLCAAVSEIADAWIKNGHADAGFGEYLKTKVSFPWSMIDKITPRPSDSVRDKLTAMGVEAMDAVITSKKTFIAPFVNAETAQYLVIEDDFPNGRPALDAAGVYMTTRETVNKSETMKVTTCLNPLHTALAVYGCILGYKSIWEEMRDSELEKLVRLIAAEGIKVVVDPKIINPSVFSAEVIEERLPNPNIPDMPQRIATDTSQKVGIRYGETIKAYMNSDTLSTAELKGIPLAIAGWLRYLLGIDDNGAEFERSADPMLDTLSKALEGVVVGSAGSANGKLRPILSNQTLFGVNLYDAGIGDTVGEYFKLLLGGKGAVRATLQKLL